MKENKIAKILKDNKLYIFLLITMTFLGIFIKMNYATDTYSVISDIPRARFNHFMLSGRFVTAIWYGIMCVLKCSPDMMSLISYIIAIITTTLALYKLYNIISKDVKNSALAILISTIIIINPFSIELFMYIERGIMMLAILMCICALECFVKFLEGENKKKQILLAIIFMIIATFSYQGVVALFVALSAVYIIKYSSNFKEFIINNIVMFMCYGIPAVLNLGIVRIFFSNDRVSGNIIITESIKKILSGSAKMLNTYSILPNRFFEILILVTLVLVLISIIVKNTKITVKIIKILSLIYVTAITLCITVLPVAMQDTASIWFVARSTYTFASILGIILLFIALEKLENIQLQKVLNIAMIAITVILLIVQYKRFNTIELDFYNKCYMEKSNSIEIGKMIESYEKAMGIKVENISIYKDKNPQYTYNGLFAVGDFNIMGFATDWSDANMINYFNNLKLKKVENNAEIQEYFSDKDWDSFNEAEVIFEGNTIHFCRF